MIQTQIETQANAETQAQVEFFLLSSRFWDETF